MLHNFVFSFTAIWLSTAATCVSIVVSFMIAQMVFCISLKNSPHIKGHFSVRSRYSSRNCVERSQCIENHVGSEFNGVDVKSTRSSHKVVDKSKKKSSNPPKSYSSVGHHTSEGVEKSSTVPPNVVDDEVCTMSFRNSPVTLSSDTYSMHAFPRSDAEILSVNKLQHNYNDNMMPRHLSYLHDTNNTLHGYHNINNINGRLSIQPIPQQNICKPSYNGEEGDIDEEGKIDEQGEVDEDGEIDDQKYTKMRSCCIM